MGKQGPCCHCGVTSTPLWRNGPAEKPILCNACGSRWRTKGTLANYTPLHARAETTDVIDEYRSSRVKTASLKANEMKFPKRKLNENEHSSVFQKNHYDDTSNRSSSGSAISNSFSESCGQFDVGDATNLADPAQSVVWETKKRTCVGQPNGSSVERLTRDLCTILHEQRKSKLFSLSYEEDLIFDSDTSMVSVETGHGSILLRCPSSVAKDEESESSSLSVENKLLSPTYPKRDKAQNEKLKIHGNHNAHLLNGSLNDVVNFDVFTHYLSHEEQQQLLKHLPSLDTASLPNSLQSMFASKQFMENIWSFQKLLAEGVLDHSLPGVSAEDCRSLKKLVLSNLSKSKWLEQYIILEDVKSKVKFGDSSGVPKQKNDNITKAGSSTIVWSTDPSQYSGLTSKTSNNHHKEALSSESGLFIAFPLDDSSNVLNSSQFVNDTSDQDLLLDVPFNNVFPEAELLLPVPNFGSKATTSCSSRSTSPQFLQP